MALESSSAGPAPRVVIRDEVHADEAHIGRVHAQAFGQPDEAEMVRRVRDCGGAVVSLVAALADPSGPVVGHVLLSPVTIDSGHEPRGLGLAPVAVLPEHQRLRIGTQLVRAALGRARDLGYGHVVVLGHAEYYPRFGFAPASRFGLRYEQPVPDEVFMALELRDGALDGAAGVVRYLPAFSEG